jgi:hypothetical protein
VAVATAHWPPNRVLPTHTGRGWHSNPHIGGVLTDAAKQVLHRQQVAFSVQDRNAGMLEISAADMAAWSAQRGQQSSKVMSVTCYLAAPVWDQALCSLVLSWILLTQHLSARFCGESAPNSRCISIQDQLNRRLSMRTAGVICAPHTNAVHCHLQHHWQRVCGRCAGARADVWLVDVTEASPAATTACIYSVVDCTEVRHRALSE